MQALTTMVFPGEFSFGQQLTEVLSPFIRLIIKYHIGLYLVSCRFGLLGAVPLNYTVN